MNHYSVDVASPFSRALHATSEIESGYAVSSSFIATADDQRVQFRAGVAWATTENSAYARCEMRETAPGSDVEFGFDPTIGQHWQRWKTRATHLAMTAGPPPRPQVVMGQLHDGTGDAVQVLTQWTNSTSQVDLLIRFNGTGSTIPNPPGQRLMAPYTVGTEFEMMFEIRENAAGVQTFYWFYNDLCKPFTSLPVSLMTNAGVLGTYYFKAGCYNQSSASDEADDSEFFSTEMRHLDHWHTGWSAPANKYGWPIVSAGGDGSGNAGSVFSRTATESGTGIVERRWHVMDGPAGAPEVGTDVGASAALAWIPSTSGTYLLRYAARNSVGWSNPSTVSVTVGGGASSGTPPQVAEIGPMVVNSSTAGSTATVQMPSAAWTTDDLVLVFLYTEHSTTATVLNPPVGFAPAPSTPVFQRSTNTCSVYVWWRRSNGNEPSSISVPVENGRYRRCAIVRVTGASTDADPWEDSDSAFVAESEITPPVDLTTTVANCLALIFVGSYIPSNWDEMFDGFTELPPPFRVDETWAESTAAQRTLAAPTTLAGLSVDSSEINGKAVWVGALKPFEEDGAPPGRMLIAYL